MITAAQSVIFQILFLLFSFDLKLSGKNIYLSQTEFSYLGMIPLLTLSFSGRVLVYQHNSVNLTRKSNSIEQPRHHLPSIHLFVHLFIKLFCCFFFNQGFGLQCKYCMVKGGWDECKKIEEEITCPSGQDRCAKAKVDTMAGNMTYTFFVKSCASEKECQDKNCGRINPGIPNLKIKKCDSACCKTNRCNDGAGISMVSGFTLFTCALAALTRSVVSKD